MRRVRTGWKREGEKVRKHVEGEEVNGREGKEVNTREVLKKRKLVKRRERKEEEHGNGTQQEVKSLSVGWREEKRRTRMRTRT